MSGDPIEHTSGLTASAASLSPSVLRAVDEIEAVFGDVVTVAGKSKSLIKFGDCSNIDNSGFKTIWVGSDLGDEEPLFGDPSLGNVLDTIVSSSTADGETVTIEGHTKSGDDLTFVSQSATLNGQTEVALGTALHDCTRVYNTSSTVLAGNVAVFDNTDGSTAGVPTDPTDVGNYILAGEQQTASSFTAISANDYFIITGFLIDANKTSGTTMYDVLFERRSTAGVWLPSGARFTVATPSSPSVTVNPGAPAMIVPKNHYVRLRAESNSATDARVSGTFYGYLASVL